MRIVSSGMLFLSFENCHARVSHIWHLFEM